MAERSRPRTWSRTALVWSWSCRCRVRSSNPARPWQNNLDPACAWSAFLIGQPAVVTVQNNRKISEHFPFSGSPSIQGRHNGGPGNPGRDGSEGRDLHGNGAHGGNPGGKPCAHGVPHRLFGVAQSP